MAEESQLDLKEITNLDNLDEFLSESDNSINAFTISNIHNTFKEYPCALGIDEAGRGPVLGPMVYGIAFCPINKLTYLEELGCADSKQLTEEKRDEIFTKICSSNNKIGWAVEVISPNKICNNMLGRKKHSLNQVSMDSAILLIKAVADAGVNIAHIFVDTVGVPEKYEAHLKSIYPKYKITVAKKADSIYPVVSAASICAKVTRDHALQMWKFQEGLELVQKDFGSGYPGDPVTKKFLVDHRDPVFGYPSLVRFSWSTASKALEEAFHVEWEDDDAEEKSGTPPKTLSITSFFKMTSEKPKTRKRADFFTKRCLNRNVEF